MKFLLILLPIAAVASKLEGLEPAAEDPVLGTETVHGCYSAVGSLQLNGTNTFNSRGLCAANCQQAGAYVAAVQGEQCYCGNEYPAASTLVDDSQCDDPCPGYAMNACGGTKAFTIINTGVEIDVQDSTDDSTNTDPSSSSSSSVISASSTSTSVPVTATTTQSAFGDATSTGNTTLASSSSSSPVAVVTSGSGSQLPLVGLNMAVLGMGALFLA